MFESRKEGREVRRRHVGMKVRVDYKTGEAEGKKMSKKGREKREKNIRKTVKEWRSTT